MEHYYSLHTVWKGNKGEGTKNIRSYDRSHTVAIEGKPFLHLTTDNPTVGTGNQNSIAYSYDGVNWVVLS